MSALAVASVSTPTASDRSEPLGPVRWLNVREKRWALIADLHSQKKGLKRIVASSPLNHVHNNSPVAAVAMEAPEAPSASRVQAAAAAQMAAPKVKVNHVGAARVDRVNARLARNDERYEARATRQREPLEESGQKARIKFCFGYFGYDRQCPQADACVYSHDVDAYMEERDLKYCPTCADKARDNFCKSTSRQCSQCVQEYLAQREEEQKRRRDEFASRPEQPCAASWRGDDGEDVYCGNYSRYKFCRDCFQVQKQYTVRR